MTRTLAIAVLVAAACKDKPSAPKPAQPTSETPRPRPSLPAPALPGGSAGSAPTGSASALPPVIESAQVAPLLPQMGAELAPLRPTSDGRQLHASWCVRDEREVMTAIEHAGWKNIESRGSGPRTGVSADRDGYRLSLVLVPSTGTACTGLAANATIFKAPEL